MEFGKQTPDNLQGSINVILKATAAADSSYFIDNTFIIVMQVLSNVLLNKVE